MCATSDPTLCEVGCDALKLLRKTDSRRLASDFSEPEGKQEGAIQLVGPILQTAAGYFLQQRDYIPDTNGTWGLLDDAYRACRFVARTSQIFTAASRRAVARHLA